MIDNSTNPPKATTPKAHPKGPILPGTIINGHYEVQRQIACGSMGTVYLCRHLALAGRVLAVKILSPELSADPIVRLRFADEVAASYDVCHSNVVRTYEYFEDGNLSGFSMEFVKGGDLLDFVESAAPLAFDQIQALIVQICDGLEAIHNAGIVHRDIKPENILLTEERVVKITDFGIAHHSSSPRKTTAGTLLGALDYLSPEYVEKGIFDKRSDIYAVGMVAYKMITNRTAFEGLCAMESLQAKLMRNAPAISGHRADCPANLEQAVLKAIARNPDERFQNIAEFRAALTEEVRVRDIEMVSAAVTRPRPTNGIFVPALMSALVGVLIVLCANTFFGAGFGFFEGALAAINISSQGEDSAVLAATPAIKKGLIHRVRYRGESLSLIASWYTGDTSNWHKIAQANPTLKPDLIQLGAEIEIPRVLITRSEPLAREFVEKSAKPAEPVMVQLSDMPAQTNEESGQPYLTSK